MTQQNRSVRRLDEASFDIIVIGGGIAGAGVARDAAMRGLRTLLVERSDFASGTSSRSSRMLHGGLRYLAQGRLGLVRESSVEKMLLSRIAPHLCQPLPFLFPTWRGSLWPRWQLSLGVRLYDLLCGERNLGRSSILDRRQTLELLRGIRTAELTGAARYFDALTNDARLVIDTLRSAEEAGAVLRNYVSFESASRRGNLWECELKDEIDGETATVHASVVVNAAGAWGSQFPQSRVRLRLTKGVHIVVDRARLDTGEAVVLSEGKRILFVIPWGERVILGTTDTDYAGDPAEVRADPADIQYILDVVNGAFPNAWLSPEDVISAWAGVRPLIASRGAARSAPSDVSRGHTIGTPEPGWIDVAGGKLTTYRLIAEQAVDRAGRFLQRRLPRSRTSEHGLTRSAFSGVLPPPIGPEVVEECCGHEWAQHLDDVMLRRTSWQFYHPNQDRIAEQVAGWMAGRMGWDLDRVAVELERWSRANFSPIPRSTRNIEIVAR